MNKQPNFFDNTSRNCDAKFSEENATFRPELVNRVRRQIAEGTYDTPERFEKALERLLDELETEA